ncbi:transposase domain-containing protein [Deltaproteobacteria bacterium TL4]
MKQILDQLGEYEQDLNIRAFSEELHPLIELSIEEEGIKKKRKGSLLQPQFLIWIVLGCAFLRDKSYPKVLEFLIGGIRWLFLSFPHKILPEGSLSRARISLGISVMESIFYKVVFHFGKIEADFYGMASVAFDGST